MTILTGRSHTSLTQREHEHRTAVQYALGLTAPDPELDAFATRLAQAAGVPYAMVKIFTSVQHFVGLHAPESGELPPVGRSMSLDDGFCPDVVDRGKALVLPDVFASPQFAGNRVVDGLNIRTYAGAPLIYDGAVLGTVCFVGPQEQAQSTGQASLVLIKEHRDQVMDFLQQRAGYRPR
ncbi:GAF domain-containing protein [Streptomyces sp. NPDC020681]|uniref:GAF domain-containing protein n=1 Tax=Streptomyces sp. NPDC020681 TaxID=3365083 RepID=UPI0037941325